MVKAVKKIGKDREALEVEPGQIARTPTKTHMGLVTEFDFTVRMKKTSTKFCFSKDVGSLISLHYLPCLRYPQECSIS